MDAWDICKQTFNYTNHTVLPEALEKWLVGQHNLLMLTLFPFTRSTDLLGRLLPRHMRIIYDINYHFLNDIKRTCSQDSNFIRRVSIIEEEPVKSVPFIK